MFPASLFSSQVAPLQFCQNYGIGVRIVHQTALYIVQAIAYTSAAGSSSSLQHGVVMHKCIRQIRVMGQ